MKINKKMVLACLLFVAGLFGQSKAHSTDTAYLEVADIQKGTWPILVFYSENGESKSLVQEKPVQGIYRFSIPTDGWTTVKIMVRNEHNLLMQGGGFKPKPTPTVLINKGSRLYVQIDSKDQLNLQMDSDDPEVNYYESFAQSERAYLQNSWKKVVQKDSDSVNAAMEAAIDQELQELRQAFDKMKKEFVSNSLEHFSGLEVFSSYYMTLDSRQALQALNHFSTDVQKSALWKSLFDKISAAADLSTGQKIPQFTATLKDGGVFRSDALSEKYWLIDFWGSWCQPCRASHPALLASYDKYKDLGFEILGVAHESGDHQRQVDQWSKAIEEDGIYWKHTLNTKENNLVELFGVSSYPTKLLIDPEGHIVFRSGGSKDDLDKILSEIFEKRAGQKQEEEDRQRFLDQMNVLLNDGTDSSRLELQHHADVLSNSDQEEDRILARQIYNQIDLSEKAEALNELLLQQFPDGITARDAFYQKQVADQKESLTADALERVYNDWLARFPKDRYDLRNQGRYDFALLMMVQTLAQKGAGDQTPKYFSQFADPGMKAIGLYYVAVETDKQGQFSKAADNLQNALLLSTQLKESPDAKKRSSFGALMYNNIAELYARVSLQLDNPSPAISLLPDILEKSNYQAMNGHLLVLTLAKALQEKGEDLNAFIVLDQYLRNNSQDSNVMAQVELLYTTLNGPAADFSQYVNRLAVYKRNILLSKIEHALIDEESPSMEWLDPSGNPVNLDDFKGKVLVLDFWATWCVPCLKSFPGMQALVEKYEGRDDVAFLFVNTWEQGDERVDKSMKLVRDHDYSFDVVFDQSGRGRGSITDQLGIGSIPAKIVIDPSGRIRFRVLGGETDTASILESMSLMVDLVLPK